MLEALASLECLNQRRWVRDKVWASSKIIIFDGAQIYTVLTWVRKNSIEPNALVRHIAQESYRGTALAGFEHVTFLFARLLQNAPGD